MVQKVYLFLMLRAAEEALGDEFEDIIDGVQGRIDLPSLHWLIRVVTVLDAEHAQDCIRL